MDFWQVLHDRRSVRSFVPEKDVPPDLIKRILEAALSAPSAGNRQPWAFQVVRNAELKQGLVEAAGGQDFVGDAPVVIVVCADASRSAQRYRERGAQLYCLQDTASAITYILLGAVALGLGACWVGAFDEERASAVLDLPDDLRPVAIIPIGYEATRPMGRTSRRPYAEVVTERN
jgi:nitroreductase